MKERVTVKEVQNILGKFTILKSLCCKIKHRVKVSGSIKVLQVKSS
jgi:hypothetical protein